VAILKADSRAESGSAHCAVHRGGRARRLSPLCPPGRSGEAAENDETTALAGVPWRVSDGTRTRDRLDHNQELYHLSYAHQATVGM
jgi:hypothetical protein